MNSGYFMIDCHGLDLIKGSTPQTIAGLYSKCKVAIQIGKPVYAVNCVWDDISVTPISVFLIQIATDTIIATSSTLQVVVTSSDVVTINNMAPSEG